MALLTVSFVLYKTEIAEVGRAIDQVHASYPEARIILVDNSPEPLALTFDDHSNVAIIRPDRNLGYGSGHNLAFALSKEDRYHAVLNTDLAYGATVFPELIAFMDAHPDVGLAMPRICYPDGSIQHLCRLLPHPFDVFGRGFFANAGWTKARNDRYEFRNWTYDSVAQFPFLSGCFMMLRRSVVDEVEGFDERFFMYGEDADLSRRIAQRNRTMFVPTAMVEHEYRSQSGGYRRFVSKVVNLSRYFSKWGWFVDRERDEMNRKAIASLDAGV